MYYVLIWFYFCFFSSPHLSSLALSQFLPSRPSLSFLFNRHFAFTLSHSYCYLLYQPSLTVACKVLVMRIDVGGVVTYSLN